MKDSETACLSIDDIGEVLFRKSKKAKRINISLCPKKGIRVTLPEKISFQKAYDIVLTKKEWIIQNKVKLNGLKENLTTFEFGKIYFTKTYTLQIVQTTETSPFFKIKNKEIKVFIPAHFNQQDPEIQKIAGAAFEEGLRREAKELLPLRVDYFATKFNLAYNKIAIKNAGTRWGSCSHKNNINLNLHLMRLPDRLCDYVILHELAHTVEKNHGKGFWNLLENMCPGAKILDKELNQYRISIY